MEEEGPILNEGELMEKVEMLEEISQQWKGERLFELRQPEGGISHTIDRIMQELQSQNERIQQIITHLANQNQLLGDFQRDALLKIGENTKAALRQQLSEINKETVNDLKAIKNTNNLTANKLLNHERRLNKIQDKLQLIWKHLGARQ